ncbi:cupin domain-containing protein [Prochlorococcus marinus]|uniref:cupin domain-containing protein n=1 Tax=Prochlorococcus marinus TaxID=1219 RepID=UPI0022B4CFEB|nr:cupin domain-containing protein [Prochlorococcus marinus]
MEQFSSVKRSKVEILRPQCNLDTVRDGRGGIFTWIPDEPLVEFNMLYFQPGKTRGFHYHPHFIEYSLVVSGSGVLVTREEPEDKESESFIHLSKGICIRTETNVFHTVYAITEMTIIAMLTKRWDHSDPPIVRIDD